MRKAWQRDAALRDGRARMISHGNGKRRFRWTGTPSRSYLRTLAQLRRVEQKRQDANTGLQHRITSQLVRDHQLIAADPGISNPTTPEDRKDT